MMAGREVYEVETDDEEEEAYCNHDRKCSWFTIFGVEGPVTVLLIFLTYKFGFAGTAAPATETERLMYVLKRGGLVIFPMFAYLWGAFRAFDSNTKAEDPFAGVESQTQRTFQKILTNNLEQTFLFFPSITALAIMIQEEYWGVVPTFLLFYTIGRWLFGAGYFIPACHNSPCPPFGTLTGWARSPGVNLSLYPTTFALMWSSYLVLKEMGYL